MADIESRLQQAAQALSPTQVSDDSWLGDALDELMGKVVPMVMDESLTEERAALRTRLLQRVETIYLYRDLARVKLRNLDDLLVIAL